MRFDQRRLGEMEALGDLPTGGEQGQLAAHTRFSLFSLDRRRILHTLFDVGELRLVSGWCPERREIAQILTTWEPIPGLLS